jgi:enamine deaminase RidA (YjgF/YER057c/UK114 family)
MRMTVFSWLGREFVRLSGEGAPGLGAADATRELLGRFDGQLRSQGLSLADTVRTRLFAPDAPSRERASGARRELLDGQARSVSSSFIAPTVFDSMAAVALDLLAVRPRSPGVSKAQVEYSPPRAPLRYLDYDGLVYLSGVTGIEGPLADQVPQALAEIGESLAMAGTGWDRAVWVSCFLHRRENVDAFQRQLREAVPLGTAPLECELVEGYASDGRLIEIELTATR